MPRLYVVQARVVHMPGMDDEPSSTFENLSLLLEKVGITSGGSEETDQPQASTGAVPRDRGTTCPSSSNGPGKVTAIDPSPASPTSVASTGPG